MASTESQLDALRSAVSSVTTCSPATTVALKALLLPKDGSSQIGGSSSATRTTKTVRSSKSTANGASKGPSKRSNPTDAGELPAKERAALATQVVNATLRALTEAAKPVLQTPSKRQPETELAKTATRSALQRSSSAPMSPLQPRSMNRVSTSPVATKTARPPAASNNSINCLSIVECARVAFSALRALQSSGKITLPELQLEAGMSSFIGKLIGLGLHEQAVKELRILKVCLEGNAGVDTRKRPNAAGSETKQQSQGLAELLDFRELKPSDPALSLIIATQIHVLRILSAMKRPAHIEAAVPILRRAHRSSLVSHLLSLAAEGGADSGKVSRQLETVSQLLLSLTPGVSSKDDGAAMEPRLSISPETALELQTLGLESRLHWWKMAGHQGDVDKDILSPLSKCLVALTRRLKSMRLAYGLCAKSFDQIYGGIQAQGLCPSESSKSPLAAIYQLLTSAARESGAIEDAVRWATDLRSLLDPHAESAGKNCSVAAQLLALQLKYDPVTYLQSDDLVAQVLAGVQGPLRGDTAELDDLLANVGSLRRAIIAVLLGHARDDKGTTIQPAQSIKESLEAFILQCPRFCLRWLGKPPAPKSSTKDYLRYEQRRQLLLTSIHHTLDSAFLLAKTNIEEQRLAWDSVETILNDSLTLLGYLGEIPSSDDAATYYVKISHFYYMKYHALRRQSTDPHDAAPLRALRRSIECVRDRPRKEKERAQFLTKLERIAELCRQLGRADEAMLALQSIKIDLVEEGVLEAVAGAFSIQPPQAAWTLDANADMLSRTLTSIAKAEKVWVNWATDLSEAEQAAILEHRLWFVQLGCGTTRQPLTLDDPTVDALLRIYNPTKFPIRRLRVLLRLLCSTVGHADLVSDIRSITADAVQLTEHDDLGDDCSLAKYLAHMKALYSSITGLIDGYPDLPALRQTIFAWRSMIEANGTAEGLEGCVDNISELLNHLQSVTDFLRMKGHEELLAAVLELSASISRAVDGPRPEDFLDSHVYLALQYANIGRTDQAERILTLADGFTSRQDNIPGEATTGFHLARTEYLLSVGNHAGALHHLSLAKAAFDTTSPVQKVTRYHKRVLFAYASYLHSLIAHERGDSHHALVYGRESVRMAFQEWSRIEMQLKGNAYNKAVSTDNSSLAASTMVDRSETDTTPVGPESWKLFRDLLRALSWLSAIYDHLGMFQETVYYAEQAEKLARKANSQFHTTQCVAWMASVYQKAGELDKSLEFATEAKSLIAADGQSCHFANLACQIGSVYRRLGESEIEAEMLSRAESILTALDPKKAATATAEGASTGLEAKMAELEIKERPTRSTRAATTTRRKAAAAATTTLTKSRAKPKPKANPSTAPEAVPLVDDVCLVNIRSSLLVEKAASMLNSKEWATATTILRQVKELAKLSTDISNGRLTMAACLLGQSLEDMAHDSVFSVVHDSTLSFPTILGSGAAVDRLSLTKHSPPPKPRSVSSHRKEASKEVVSQRYMETLREAQECLVEAHATAAVSGDASLLHRISTMLQNVTLLLLTISAKSKTLSQAGHATSSTELVRNLTWRRERKVIMQEKMAAKPDGTAWPVLLSSSSDPQRSSIGFSSDSSKFQRDYIEVIPKNWTAISITLGENKHDLCITRLQAGHSPFVIRLPLERASSRDADSEVFNFQQGRSELLEIIKLANETCHDARDMTVKGAKAAWWADREALDQRLKELLELIERDWLGGFRGIFSQHRRRADLLARFQKSFQKVLDKHLPSRRQVRGRKSKAATATAASKVTLDPRILELFVGLGDATEEDCDFDEELTDLLYFVVDILQFHGERNAYDEIDFDVMVVETFDALRAYHAAAKADPDAEDGTHTILVLDKALHAFPWESLPCMQGLAVSRVPSLACLRRMILEQRPPAASASEEQGIPTGHHVSPTSGTYILNPSQDLENTLKTFEAPLSAQLPTPSWTPIVSRVPTEQEFESALTDTDILLYIGHGSGAQYIRGRTVRRLDKCRAVALLMGCSSASLADAGEYEAQGPVWNYLMAGCPAVAGTLWDVTDRDIDRFAGRALEEWGLLEGGTFVEERRRCRVGRGGKGKQGREGVVREGGKGKKISLVEAVATAREEACRFRYLTAAAVVVYGIPVYIDR